MNKNLPRHLLTMAIAAAATIIVSCAHPIPTATDSSVDRPDFAKTNLKPTDSKEPMIESNDPSKSNQNPARAKISTAHGDIFLELDWENAPKTCSNFVKLANDGFYNGTTFHRVIPGFMIQGGDPNSRSEDRSKHGMGGPGYTVPEEISGKHSRGAVATARLPDQVNPRKDSSGSQFFICVADSSFLDGEYTVFAKVVSGIEVADKIVAEKRDRKDNPLNRIEMTVTPLAQ